jgi:hypothetical protein
MRIPPSSISREQMLQAQENAMLDQAILVSEGERENIMVGFIFM